MSATEISLVDNIDHPGYTAYPYNLSNQPVVGSVNWFITAPWGAGEFVDTPHLASLLTFAASRPGVVPLHVRALCAVCCAPTCACPHTSRGRPSVTCPGRFGTGRGFGNALQRWFDPRAVPGRPFGRRGLGLPLQKPQACHQDILGSARWGALGRAEIHRPSEPGP